MNLNNIHLIVQDQRIINEINSLNKVFIIAISILLLTPVIILILSDTEMISKHRKFSIIAITVMVSVIGLEYQILNIYFKPEVTKYQVSLTSKQTKDIITMKEIKKEEYDYIKKLKVKESLGEKVSQEDLNKIKDIMVK